MQFPVRLVARRTPGCMMWLSPVLALGLTVLFGAILFAMLGKDPLNALYVFLIAPLETLRGWAEVGVKMTPLLLCAGLVVCFRASIWNIGAEGQFLAGAITGGWAALACPDGIGHWYLVIVLLAGIAGGAFWGGITALLKDKFNANEILVSLMLVYVAQFGIDLIRIPVHVGFVCAWSNRVDLDIVFTKVKCKRLRHATDGKF